jgi:hypothetical protein
VSSPGADRVNASSRCVEVGADGLELVGVALVGAEVEAGVGVVLGKSGLEEDALDADGPADPCPWTTEEQPARSTAARTVAPAPDRPRLRRVGEIMRTFSPAGGRGPNFSDPSGRASA